MKNIEKLSEAIIPTPFGNFNMIAFESDKGNYSPHIAMVAEGTDMAATVNVRFHSECLTGDLFHSMRCDCGQQLDAAMTYVAQHGGLILYLRQEGRGIGIIEKLKAYQLQDKGQNTIEANLALGHKADSRNFDVAVQMLRTLGVSKINLLTNNPIKIEAVDDSEIVLNKRIPLEISPNDINRDYLRVKKQDMGHLLGEHVAV